ncbi:MAG: nuclear transport factor 2 family protein, partial [bacterium]
MIEKTIQNWHDHMRGNYEPGLDGLIHDDCVFYSPVVFTPQKGKEITIMYLNAAGATLG